MLRIGAHSVLSLGQVNLHFLNNPSELSVNTVCDHCLATLDTTVVQTVAGIRNELFLLLSKQSPSPPPSIATFSFLLSDLYATVQKIDKKVTSASGIQMKALLHCLQLTMGETPLLLFPKAETLQEGTSNALEALLQYDGNLSSQNSSTCIVGPFLVDVYGLLQLTSTFLHLGKALLDYRTTSLAGAAATGPSDDLPPFLEFDFDLRAMLQNIRLLNLVTNEGEIRLNDVSAIHIPSVTITKRGPQRRVFCHREAVLHGPGCAGNPLSGRLRRVRHSELPGEDDHHVHGLCGLLPHIAASGNAETLSHVDPSVGGVADLL